MSSDITESQPDMGDLPQVSDFTTLILNDTPLIDVRAPVEFADGTVSSATNLPLINDSERHEIGLRYKNLGQDAAIDLGHELVQGETKQERVTAWEQFAQQHPEGVLFCWRGGMRSKISQQWLYEQSGIVYPRIEGGFKALRRFLIDETTAISHSQQLLMLGGRTGSGKTRFLETVQGQVDLEGLANHRGSAFGPRATPQPNQVDFENQLAIELIKHQHAGFSHLILEDEGRNVGARMVPEPLFEQMRAAPLILLNVPDEERISVTFQEYIDDALAEFRSLYGEDEGFEMWQQYLLTSLDKIRKRLGGQRHQQLKVVMETALQKHRDHADTQQHNEWIEALLLEYYDPMYDYQIEKKRHKVVFEGDRNAVKNYISNQQHNPTQ